MRFNTILGCIMQRFIYHNESPMLRTLVLTTAPVFSAALPGQARNLSVPAKNPAATLMIPDSWTPTEIEFGYSGTSPDGKVFFSAEYASAARIDTRFETNDARMKENKIQPKGEPKKREITRGGLKATLFSYQASDENGATEINFVTIRAGNRIVLLTLWGSGEEQKANRTDVELIENSVKAIN